MLRVRGDPGQARLALLDRLTQVDPALDHEVQTMRTVAGMGAYILADRLLGDARHSAGWRWR